MAVIKSVLLGQARKSIGDTNLYRVKGVQLARTKATFPPSRVFSPAQLLQQKRMRLTQLCLSQCWLTRFSDFCIVRNPRKYNAANRTNTFVSRLMKGVTRNVATACNDGWDVMGQYSDLVLADYAVGNVLVVDPNFTFSFSSGVLTATIDKKASVVEELLYKANRTRSEQYKLTFNNLVFLWAGGGSNGNYDAFHIALPIFANPSATESGNKVTFLNPLYMDDGNKSMIPADTWGGSDIYGCLAVCERYDLTTDTPFTTALACTNSFWHYGG